MVQAPLGPDFVVPVKSPLVAVMVTPGIGARSSPRKKPLMLLVNWVADGDGVGEGVAALDAGATMSSSAAMAANTAPTALNSLPRRLCDRPLVVLLKLKTSTWGCCGLRLCNRCERSGDERLAIRSLVVMSVTLCGLCYSPGEPKNAAASRQNVAIG